MQKNIVKLLFAHRIIVATGILLFAIIYFMDVQELKNPQDRLLINPVFWIMVILYPIVLWQEWRKWTKERDAQESPLEEEDETKVTLTKKVAYFMLSIILYLTGIHFLGFITMTILVMPVLMWILGLRSKKLLIFIPVFTAFILYLLFGYLLGIPLPQGILIEGVF